IESFEKTADGVRMNFSKDGLRDSTGASVVVVAVGWVANTAALNLEAAGVETDHRGYVRVDAHLSTSAAHIFAAGDVTGHLLLVPQALQECFVAGTNAVLAATTVLPTGPIPIGSFTDAEYAQVGLTEAAARETHDVVTGIIRFDSTTRTIIDGRTNGFCKLIVDRATYNILGCHVVGERAVDIVQVASDSDGGRDACGRSRSSSALVSHLCWDPRPPGSQRGSSDQPRARWRDGYRGGSRKLMITRERVGVQCSGCAYGPCVSLPNPPSVTILPSRARQRCSGHLVVP